MNKLHAGKVKVPAVTVDSLARAVWASAAVPAQARHPGCRARGARGRARDAEGDRIGHLRDRSRGVSRSRSRHERGRFLSVRHDRSAPDVRRIARLVLCGLFELDGATASATARSGTPPSTTRSRTCSASGGSRYSPTTRASLRRSVKRAANLRPRPLRRRAWARRLPRTGPRRLARPRRPLRRRLRPARLRRGPGVRPRPRCARR